VNDAETRFAERLAEDLDRVLGVGIAIDDVELSVGKFTRSRCRRPCGGRACRGADRMVALSIGVGGRHDC
jgi:hypothetical protein